MTLGHRLAPLQDASMQTGVNSAIVNAAMAYRDQHRNTYTPSALPAKIGYVILYVNLALTKINHKIVNLKSHVITLECFMLEVFPESDFGRMLATWRECTRETPHIDFW